MSELIERARAYRAKIEAAATIAIEDDEALNFPSLFPVWCSDGIYYKIGDRVRWGENLYNVVQTHTSQPNLTPINSPSLFAIILPGQGGTEIGQWVQPDSTNPYMVTDRVIFDGKIYESTINNNVWSPVAYPAGWKEITEE